MSDLRTNYYYYLSKFVKKTLLELIDLSLKFGWEIEEKQRVTLREIVGHFVDILPISEVTKSDNLECRQSLSAAIAVGWPSKARREGKGYGREGGGAVGHMTCAMPTRPTTISEVQRRKISRKIISIYLIFCCICLASLSAFPL